MKFHRLRLAAAASILATLLAACGGGGGGDAPPPSTATTTPPPASSAAGATYAAGSAQRLAFDQLNASRQRCGFGVLAQSAPLDQAATAHASYMARNGEFGHGEDPSKPGFTGASALERAVAAGYPAGSVGEDLSTGGFFVGSTAADSIRNLLAAPYHAQSLLTGFRDVGLAWTAVNARDTLVANLGVQQSASFQGPQGVATFPCEGTPDAVPRATNETPSPFPNDPSAAWGQPITVAGPNNLRITSATITGPSGPVRVLALYGTGATTDPNGEFTGGWFSVIPDVLQPTTSYAVAIDYTAGGTAGSTRFTFTTAAH